MKNINLFKMVSIALVAFTVGFGVASLNPEPGMVILSDNAVLKNVQSSNVIFRTNSHNVQIVGNSMELPYRITPNFPVITLQDGSNTVSVVSNLFVNNGSVFESIRDTIFGKPEIFCAVINGVKYKSCDDIPTEVK